MKPIHSDPGLVGELEHSTRRAGLRHGLSVIADRTPRPARRSADTQAPIYMVRWLVARIFGWECKFNLFLSSDPGCLHDHPWPFLSVMLAGSYQEQTETGRRTYRAPCILYRPARWKHRIAIVEPCLTFNVSAPRRRNWGFWTPLGWIRHDRYDESTHQC